MGKFSAYIGSQCGNPRGFVGKCCCLLMNVINRAMYRAIVNCLNLNQELAVLDIGYGNGYLVSKIYQNFRCAVFGIDISEDMQSQAVKRNQTAISAGKMQLLTGDCCALAFADSSFDAVTSVNTIYFWEDTLKGLTEIHRVLKKGGYFYNAVYSKEWLQKLSYTRKGFHLFSKEQLLQLGQQAGYSEVVIREIVNGKSYLVQYKR